jgi:hypothetical protein
MKSRQIICKLSPRPETHVERDKRSHWSLRGQLHPSSCGLTRDTASPSIELATFVHMRRGVSR